MHFDDCDGIIVRLGVTLDENLLKKFARLKFIGTITTGLDHIDLEYCDKNNIEVISLKGESEFLSEIRATPEHTWGLLFSLIRSLPQAILSVKNNCWDSSLCWGEELFNKTIGIIGFGQIGRRVADRLKPFNVDFLIYDPNIPNEKVEKYGKKVDLNFLMRESDFITIHAVATDENDNLINEDRIGMMKKTAFLLNTSKGSLVDYEALYNALKNNKIAGAALDVFEDMETVIVK